MSILAPFSLGAKIRYSVVDTSRIATTRVGEIGHVETGFWLDLVGGCLDFKSYNVISTEIWSHRYSKTK